MSKRSTPEDSGNGEAVAAYYNDWTLRYLSTYGTVFQAYRTRDPRKLLDLMAAACGLRPGLKVLDAGCGVCGPALHFAQSKKVSIDAVTVSPEQVAIAKRHVEEAGLSDRIAVKVGDFHHLDQLYPEAGFDVVLFLEALGHSSRPATVLEACNRVVKVGGGIYIKDFFQKHGRNAHEQSYVDAVVQRVNANYAYNVLDLEGLIRIARGLGWEIEFVRPLPVQTEISTRARFEKAFGVDNYNGAKEKPYADWLELKFNKTSDALWAS